MLLCQFCKEKYVYRDVKVCCRLLLFEYSLLRSYNLNSLNFWPCNTAQKVSKYRVISGPCFPVFGLNTEIYSVNLRIQSEYRKIQTRNNSVFGHFSRSAWLIKNIIGGNIYLSLTKRQTKHFQHCGWNRVLWIRVKKSHWKVIYKHRCSTVLLFFTQSYI